MPNRAANSRCRKVQSPLWGTLLAVSMSALGVMDGDQTDTIAVYTNIQDPKDVRTVRSIPISPQAPKLVSRVPWTEY